MTTELIDKPPKTLGEKISYNCNSNKIQTTSPRILGRQFYNKACYDLAIALLGKTLVRKISNSMILKGRIVETECYLGGIDKASHSYNGRRTSCNEPMYMIAGTSYVYNIYGIYCCFNISSLEPGAAVLIRALEPIDGLEAMTLNRLKKFSSNKKIKSKDLCNGPSKLCLSMLIDKKSCNQIDLTNNLNLWIEDDNFNNFKVIKSTRIGIDACGEEWSAKLLRFYILNNLCVSKRDKEREKIDLELKV